MMRTCPFALILVVAFFLAVVLAVLEAVRLKRITFQMESLRLELEETRRQDRDREETHHRYENKIHALNRETRDSGSALEQERKRHLETLRLLYGWLGRLQQVQSSMEVLQQEVEGLLQEAGLDSGEAGPLSEFLDKRLDGMVTALKKEVPKLSEEDILLFCYLVVGYDKRLSARMLGIRKMGTYYSRKTRLVQRIQLKARSHAQRYLDYIP